MQRSILNLDLLLWLGVALTLLVTVVTTLRPIQPLI